MTPAAFAALPDALVVRELRYRVAGRGRRTRRVTLATTLLDPKRYPASDLATLYGQRWQAETHFRELKQTLRMDVLRCQTVEGVNKELALYAFVSPRQRPGRPELFAISIKKLDALAAPEGRREVAAVGTKAQRREAAGCTSTV
jgi:hypothetical protein